MSEQCRYNKDCYTGNCVKNVCKKSEPKGKCSNTPSNTCPPGYECATSKCVQTAASRALVAAYPECGPGKAACVAGFYCFKTSGSDGRCVPARPLGATCSTDVKCQNNLVCYSGYCVPSCTDSFGCDPNFECKSASSGKGCIRQIENLKKSTTNKTASSNKTASPNKTSSTPGNSTPTTPKQVVKPWYIKHAPWIASISVLFAVVVILAIVLIMKKSRSRQV